MMYVCALENCELEEVLNIIHDSFAISVMSSFNIYKMKAKNELLSIISLKKKIKSLIILFF